MKKLVAMLTAVMSAGACSSAHHATNAATTTRPGAPPTVSSGGSGPATSTTVAVSSTNAVGARVASANGGSVTFFSYAAPVTPNDRNAKLAPAGKEYATADVQSCAGPAAGTSAGPADFLLQLSDGRQVGPRITVRDPGLSITVLKANGCVRGFITFEIDAGATASLLVYIPESAAWHIA